MHLGATVEQVEQQQDAIAFTYLNDLANKTVKLAADDCYCLARREWRFRFPNGTVNFAGLHAFNEASRQKGRNVAIAHHRAYAISPQDRPAAVRCCLDKNIARK